MRCGSCAKVGVYFARTGIGWMCLKLDDRVRLQNRIHASHEGNAARLVPEVFEAQIRCHKRGGARRIGHNARPVQPKLV